MSIVRLHLSSHDHKRVIGHCDVVWVFELCRDVVPAPDPKGALLPKAKRVDRGVGHHLALVIRVLADIVVTILIPVDEDLVVGGTVGEEFLFLRVTVDPSQDLFQVWVVDR